jgi:rubrerythrin
MKSGYSWSELVEMAIQVEKTGEKFYRDSAARSEGRSTEFFKELADAERVHAEIFYSLLPDGFVEGSKGIDAEEAKEYIGAIVGQGLLGYLRGSDATSFDSAREILEFALGFEKESVGFYTSLKDHVTDASGPVVERIIAEEKKHIERIEAMLASL